MSGAGWIAARVWPRLRPSQRWNGPGRVPEFEAAWDRLHLLFRGDPADFPGPFGRGRRGFVPGEGASFVVLESREAAARRGAVAWAEILGESMAHAPGPVHRWHGDPGSAAAA